MQTTNTSFNQNVLPGKFSFIGFHPFLLVLFPNWISGWWSLVIVPAILVFLYRLYAIRQKTGQGLFKRPIKSRFRKDQSNTRLKINGSSAEHFSNNPMENLENQFVQEVQQIIEAHLTNPQFSIQDICQHVGMSHSQLHRKLTATIGLPASKLIKSIKISRAKTLLQNPDLTITAVAFDSGFNDPDYFHRVFKKEVGLTPTQYRESVI